MSATTVDEAKLERFLSQMVGHMTGAAACFGIWLGDELGLYAALAKDGTHSSDDVASDLGCHPRLVREWLDGQVAAGLVEYHPDADRYSLSAEAVIALADETSPVFTARAMNAFGAMFMDMDKVKAAFTGGGGLAWGDHHPCLFKGTEWFFRTGYRAYLPGEWIPALDGFEDKLKAGARVADLGCGHGASVVVMADAYPNSRFWGFDYHAASIEIARERAREAGVEDRTTFEVASAKNYRGTYDLICFFDCLHDMGDPVGIAAYARQHLDPDGAVLLVEPFALDERRENLQGNPMAALLYTASTAICVPNSLSQEVGLGLGAQAGEARLRALFEEAGFSRFRRAAETPLNLVLEARP
jgi:2-polyprenyl-3-methyl-5-hydroxy-6-metoxy-1,4-benzoquinol methylase